MRRYRLGAAASAIAALLSLASLPQTETASPPTITFFVGSDSHFGAEGMPEANRLKIEQMNALPGTEYPQEIGGRVEVPRGVLMTGDLTDNGTLEEFALFETFYGLTGKDALLRYPVFEAIGNHDVNTDSPIKERQRQRHGGVNYAWDWDDVRFLCLDMYPDALTREWLKVELRKAGPERPLVLFFHYPDMAGSRAWTDEDKEAFGRAIDAYNVIAIFHGHQHSPGHYVWRDRPVFRPGAARSRQRAFLVVRLGPRQMSVATWNFETAGWGEAWSVPVRRPGVVGATSSGSR